jgi:hypothetical protein
MDLVLIVKLIVRTSGLGGQSKSRQHFVHKLLHHSGANSEAFTSLEH